MGISMYWEQWAHEELMSMHGIDEVDTNLCHDDVDTSLSQDYAELRQTHDCGRCMYCLGVSW